MGDQTRIIHEMAKTVLALEKRIAALEAPKPKRKVSEVRNVAGGAGNISQIVANVAFDYGVAISDIMGPCRAPKWAWPRQHAYAMASDDGYSLAAIGRHFGRDHSTISSGIAAHRARVSP